MASNARKRDIDGLREMLFKAAERLEDATAEQLDAELLRARAIGDIGKVLVETARVEVTRERFSGQPAGGSFLPPRQQPSELPPPAKPKLVSGGG